MKRMHALLALACLIATLGSGGPVRAATTTITGNVEIDITCMLFAYPSPADAVLTCDGTWTGEYVGVDDTGLPYADVCVGTCPAHMDGYHSETCVASGDIEGESEGDLFLRDGTLVTPRTSASTDTIVSAEAHLKVKTVRISAHVTLFTGQNAGGGPDEVDGAGVAVVADSQTGGTGGGEAAPNDLPCGSTRTESQTWAMHQQEVA